MFSEELKQCEHVARKYFGSLTNVGRPKFARVDHSLAYVKLKKSSKYTLNSVRRHWYSHEGGNARHKMKMILYLPSEQATANALKHTPQYADRHNAKHVHHYAKQQHEEHMYHIRTFPHHHSA